MTKKILYIVAALAIFPGLFLTMSGTHASSGGVDWLGYDEGLSQSELSEKKVLINFYAEWCRYCKVMDRKTFKDPAVVSYLNKNFIPIRVNSDKEPKTAETFKVRGLPDT